MMFVYFRINRTLLGGLALQIMLTAGRGALNRNLLGSLTPKGRILSDGQDLIPLSPGKLPDCICSALGLPCFRPTL